jgi:hypothetical protein
MAKQTVQALARLGYGARGAVYLIVGGLAAASALGAGGRPTGGKGAIETLLGQPFGVALVAATATGLFAFCLWRLLQAVLDADRHGATAKGLVIRAALLVSGLIYLGLMLSALGLLLGWGGGGGEDREAKEWTAWLLAQPFGRWAVGVVGAAVAIAGAAIAARGWKGAFRRRLALDATSRKWVEPLGRYGLTARGAVLAVIGGFLISAAWRADPDEARGLAGALEALRAQPYGGALFAFVALGLLAFGFYGLAQALYRKVVGP